MAINFDEYKKILKKQVRDGTLTEKTARSYLSCMEKLCEELKEKDGCNDIAQAIKTLGNGNEQIPRRCKKVRARCFGCTEGASLRTTID